ncbi:hypothetical protein NUW54_g12722 [Trametes sanguinea]|uniref:Uncharacterized protein n=1 Tax=Trametes sanguinea TaxID=158606 RepID=A0ACC1MUH5_9APHY|nr:hypothetical protein NUW54_g12722 [Trametes sanguinea]
MEVLDRFGYRDVCEELRGATAGTNLHRLENVLTLEQLAHTLFDRLDLWFEEVEGKVLVHFLTAGRRSLISDVHLQPHVYRVGLVPSRTPVGTIRCVKLKEYYKLSRLAVLKDYRKYRFGAALVQSLHDHVKADARASGLAGSDAAAKVIAHSQIPVKGFYAKFGYVPEGEEFDEDGAPHQKMVARLSLSD